MATKEAQNVGELIRLPSGLMLFYCDDDHPTTPHSYWRANEDLSRGRRLTGVTSAIMPIDFEKDRLMAWAARLQGLGIARLVDGALELDDIDAIRTELHWLDPLDADRIWDELTRQKLTYDDIREAKAVTGTNIHEQVLRALAEGKEVPDFSQLRPDEEGYGHAVIDFWLDHNPDPLYVEQIVYHDELGVAGRFDLGATMRQNCADPLCPCHLPGDGLIDCKTGTFIGEKEHTQVSLYNICAKRSGIGTDGTEDDPFGFAWEGLLHVHADGTYRLWPGEASPEGTLSTVKTYRERGSLRNRIGKARDARKGKR